jgi:predicted dehydrogenase
MKRVRCGVIGAGWWGTTAHLPALRDHPGADVVAVQTADPGEARRIARDFNVPQSFTSHEELLATPGLEAVVISSTANMHYEQAKAALSRGLHVLLEKPMTLTFEQARHLERLARDGGLHLLIGCPWHYTAHNIEARRLIREGQLGPVKMISVLMSNFSIGLYQGKPWQDAFGTVTTRETPAQPYVAPGVNSYSDPAVAGGGHLYCQVSHVGAHLAFVTDALPTEVFCRLDHGGTRVDVYDTLNIKMSNGAIVSVGTTGATMFSDRHYEVRIYGPQGMILLELWRGTMSFHDHSRNVTHYEPLPDAELYPLFAPTRNFIDLIAGTAENGSPGSLGVAAMAVIDSAYRSAREGTNVTVPWDVTGGMQ